MSLSYASEKKTYGQRGRLPENGPSSAIPALYRSNQLTEKYMHSSAADDLAALPHTERTVTNELGDKLRERFGTDMTGVRIFEDEGLKEQFNQRAYAKGNEIHINKGEFSPNTSSGEELLMHEAGHVIQQGSGMVSSSGIVESPSLESGADNISAPANFTMPTADGNSAIQGWNPFKKVWKSFKSSHNRAVDEITNNYDDYKKMSKWDRFKWTIANPLARLDVGGGTQARNNARNFEDAEAIRYRSNINIDPILFAPPSASDGTLAPDIAMTDKQKTANDVSGYLSKGGTASSLLSTGLGTLGKGGFDIVQKGKEFSKKDYNIGGSASVFSALGSGLSAASNAMNAKKNSDKGNRAEAAKSGLSAITDAGNMAAQITRSAKFLSKSTNNAVFADTKLVPGMDVVSGGMNMVNGIIGLASSTSTRSKMSDRINNMLGNEKDEDKRKINRSNLSAEDEEKLQTLEQAKEMAKINQIGSGFDIGSGALKAAGGAMKLGGVTALAGTAVGALGTGLGLAKGLAVNSKKSDMRKDVVNKAMPTLENEITQYCESKGLDPEAPENRSTAKHIILKSLGYKSGKRKEVFQNITMKRAYDLKSRAEEGDGKNESADIIKDLGIHADKNGKYSLQGISEKLGMESDKSWEDQMNETKNMYENSIPFAQKAAEAEAEREADRRKKAEKKARKEAKKAKFVNFFKNLFGKQTGEQQS